MALQIITSLFLVFFMLAGAGLSVFFFKLGNSDWWDEWTIAVFALGSYCAITSLLCVFALFNIW